jgi:YbbR domain-containing protein
VVAYTSNPTQTNRYPVKLDRPVLPSGLVLVGDVPTVIVNVIGTAENLKQFDSRTLHVTGNFANVKVGHDDVPIRVDNGDPNVTIDAPSTVGVTVDELGSATLTVSIERIRALPSGYHEQTSATTITPAGVKVDGPKSKLAGIQAVVLVDLVDAATNGINKPYTVVIWDANKKVVPQMTVTPPQVTVKMVIQADAVTESRPVGWTLTGQPAAGYRVTNVTIAPLEVLATGLQATLNNLLLATDPVDISNAKGDVVRTVTIRPPSGVEVAQKTATVHVFISQAPGVSPSP